jgi:phosphatidylglycerophosphate synthase
MPACDKAVFQWLSSPHPAQAPAWVNYYAAAAIFIYQTLDALDGKQARRTGTGSCLGELFDHGCDAFTTVMVVCHGYWL